MKPTHFLACLMMVAAGWLSSLELRGQSARLTGPIINVEPDVFGYNTNHFQGELKWNEEKTRRNVARLHPGNLRYPGGTQSNYWDWRTGNIIETIKTGYPRYLDDSSSQSIATFVNGIPENTQVVYCINMARPTPATGIDVNSSYDTLASQETLDAKIIDILAGIDAFYQAGYSLKYVELGNEFYQGAIGGVGGQGGVYSGDTTLYINHANQIARAIAAAYPQIEMAVIGESDWDDKGRPWTQAIYHALANGRLTNIDAITFHWYTGPGVLQLIDAEDAMQSLGVPFGKSVAIKERDYDTAPEGLALWITEYNTWSPARLSNNPDNPGYGGPIQGTWTNGLFGANLGLLYTLMGDKIDLIDIHSLNRGSNPQWAMMTRNGDLSGNGVAVGTVAQAIKGMTQARRLAFDNLPSPTFNDGDPSLHGAKFWNGEQESVVIINNTNQVKKGINIRGLFSGGTPRQLTRYYDPSPWDTVSELSGIIRFVGEQRSDRLDMPPFSITVLMRTKLPQEQTKVIVSARGQTGEETFELQVDGRRVGNPQTVTTSMATYSFTIPTEGVIRVAFTNNGMTSSGKDKNLFVDKITVNGQVFESEDQSVNTGSWNAAEGKCGGTKSAWLYCGGYIEYGTFGSTPSGKVVIRARGTCGSETMVLQVAGTDVKTWTNLSTSFTDYTYDSYSGSKNVKVRFTNDGTTSSGCDKNLVVDKITVCGTAYQAESVTRNGCGAGEWLYCNGNFDFGSVGCSASVASGNSKLAGDELVSTTTHEQFKVYPNPASQQLTVQGSEDYQVTLYDMSGRKVMQHKHLTGAASLDVKGIKPGLYLIKISDANQQQISQRVIIE